MGAVKIGILGTADVALRRFLPALQKSEEFLLAGIASRALDNAQRVADQFQCKGYHGYESLVSDSEIEAVYIPLPPSLHYQWAVRALECGKHVLVEKPFTTTLGQTEEVIQMARSKKLAAQENYMFLHHSQVNRIEEIINGGVLGDVRLLRAAFGFPGRPKEDFRYSGKMGGGALLDCGGYTVRLAWHLLGSSAVVKTSRLNYLPEHEVDIYGSATLENERGQVAQVAFGMDNNFKCDLEIWGSEGNLKANRIFTAPDGFVPEVFVNIAGKEKKVVMESDDHFLKSLSHFYGCIRNDLQRETEHEYIMLQAKLLESIQRRDSNDCN